MISARLFVYGSLMRGQSAHALLGNARFIGRTRTAPEFTLHLVGQYPALVASGDTAIAGELYEVDFGTLERLDRYEEAPELYQRRTIPLATGEALAYVLRPEHAQAKPIIASGDFRRR